MRSNIVSIVLLLFILNLTLSASHTIEAKNVNKTSQKEIKLAQKESVSITEQKNPKPEYKIKKVVKKTITAYSSSPDETDSTPFITANNTKVRDGIVAANSLPFGAKIMIPEIFGEKIFIVEDRTHKKYSSRIDIWMPSKKLALQFGKQIAEVYIIED